MSGQGGERNHRAKLTEGGVREIRRAALDGTASQRELARRFSVHESCISKIINRMAWSHLP